MHRTWQRSCASKAGTNAQRSSTQKKARFHFAISHVFITLICLLRFVKISQRSPNYDLQAIFRFVACTGSMCMSFHSASPTTTSPWYPHTLCPRTYTLTQNATSRGQDRKSGCNQKHELVTRATRSRAYTEAWRQLSSASCSALYDSRFSPEREFLRPNPAQSPPIGSFFVEFPNDLQRPASELGCWSTSMAVGSRAAAAPPEQQQQQSRSSRAEE